MIIRLFESFTQVHHLFALPLFQALGASARNHMSSDTPSPDLIEKALGTANSIKSVIKQMKLLRKLLKKLAVENEQWNWWSQLREHLSEVQSSLLNCLVHVQVVASACLWNRGGPSERATLSERISKLKRIKKEQFKSKKGYAKVTGDSGASSSNRWQQMLEDDD
jgi:two-component SAPR family response regulator